MNLNTMKKNRNPEIKKKGKGMGKKRDGGERRKGEARGNAQGERGGEVQLLFPSSANYSVFNK